MRQAILNFIADFGSAILEFATSRGAYDDLHPTEEEMWAAEQSRQRAEHELYQQAKAEGYAEAARTYTRQ